MFSLLIKCKLSIPSNHSFAANVRHRHRHQVWVHLNTGTRCGFTSTQGPGVGSPQHRDQVWVHLNTGTRCGFTSTQGPGVGSPQHRDQVWVHLNTGTRCRFTSKSWSLSLSTQMSWRAINPCSIVAARGFNAAGELPRI